ncbi:DNA cytosine methyltransferase, partial [Klebsiella pneumoniae]
TAGYPCQPFSNAGKRKGTDDPRHIWPWIARAIGVLRPRFIVLENVAAHVRRGFDVVSEDLATLGYDTAWSVVRASDVGAPHRRERLFIVAADSVDQYETRARWEGEHSDGRGVPSLDLSGVGRREGWPESEGVVGGPDVAERGSQVDWRQYTPAIRRWEGVLGVPVPRPDARGPRGGLKVNPTFAEWLMGVPGRITSVPG